MTRRREPVKHYVSSDFDLPREFREEAATIRGAITAAAERVALPARFEAVLLPDRPCVRIVDMPTRREAVVPLSAYRAVREVLAELFVDDGL